MNNSSEIILHVPEDLSLIDLYGEGDSKINNIRKAFPDVGIIARGYTVKLSGPKSETQAVKVVFERMFGILKHYKEITSQTVQELVGGSDPREGKIPPPGPDGVNHANVILYGKEGQPIRARTQNQKKLIDMVENNDIVFAIGPAGTGKTYTAVAMAVRALKARTVKRIVLTRPAVEAGENLGFLPGDLKEKIDPYLRPLYDALHDMIHHEKLAQLIESNTIEIAPLAFMRGRTLDNAFIILDEAQNTTESQIKMFLTRLGPSAKCVITGDLTQIDLPHNQKSGLVSSTRVLENISGIGITYLNSDDVVRHRLVKEIVRAYDRADEERKRFKEEREAAAKKKADGEQPVDNQTIDN